MCVLSLNYFFSELCLQALCALLRLGSSGARLLQGRVSLAPSKCLMLKRRRLKATRALPVKRYLGETWMYLRFMQSITLNHVPGASVEHGQEKKEKDSAFPMSEAEVRLMISCSWYPMKTCQIVNLSRSVADCLPILSGAIKGTFKVVRE